MPSPLLNLQGFRPLLLEILEARDGDVALSKLASISHRMAYAYLCGRKQRGSFGPGWNGLRLSDIAYDCLGDLFQRDESGRACKILAYFGGIDVDRLSEEELLIYLRRLVVSAVNQRIFRLYQEYDPSLGRILRNMKLAIRTLENFSETERFGEAYICPALCPTLEHLPEFDRQSLVEHLQTRVSGTERVPELLATLSRFLRHQTERSRMVPLVQLALAFRDLYELKNVRIAQHVEPPSEALIDIEMAISNTCASIKAAALKTYAAKKKISREILDAYIQAIDSALTNRLVHHDPRQSSLYEELRKNMPTLTEAQYRRIHRTRLEYLSKLANKTIAKELEMS
jgi:hypothetical protein